MVAAVAIMGYAVWNFQKKTAAREAAAQQRFADLLRGGQGSGGGQSASAPAPAASASTSAPASHAVPAAPAVAIPPAAAPAAAVAAVAARERFLGQHETLLYLVLKTGLPDHEIFANVSLAAVVALPASGSEREQQIRRLAPYQLDFVVCDKSMHVIAAVDIETAGGADAAGIQQFKADYLKRAGIRLVRVNPAAMPKRDQVRALVVGGNAAPAAT
jgi:intracellular sulfur oxidation DsrE/DsrF family protein